MTLELASFAFGGLLILTAMFGGGLQVKEIVIPRIGAGARGACMAVGLLFIGVAIFINPVATGGPTAGAPIPTVQDPKPTPARAEAVSFHIHDELGEGQVSEQVKVVIDGRTVGTITVSALHPKAELLVVVPRQDRYSYQLAANAVFLDEGEKPVEYIGIGEGYINAREGKHFSLEGELSGVTWLARLVEDE